MRVLAIAIVTAAAAALAGPALAQDYSTTGTYFDLGYTHYDTHSDDLGGITGRLGYRFHPNFAAEAELTGGVSDDSNAKLKDAYGVYGVGIVPISSQFDLFGRVGYQKVEIDGRHGFPDRRDDGVGYGAGAAWHVANGFGLRGQYTRLEGANANAWELAAAMRF